MKTKGSITVIIVSECQIYCPAEIQNVMIRAVSVMFFFWQFFIIIINNNIIVIL